LEGLTRLGHGIFQLEGQSEADRSINCDVPAPLACLLGKSVAEACAGVTLRQWKSHRLPPT
jgi:hypothetical protein